MITQIGQLRGPFKANEKITFKNIQKIFKIAIISKTNHTIKIWQPSKDSPGIETETTILLSENGILEFRDAYISGLAFLQDEDEDTHIDYMIAK